MKDIKKLTNFIKYISVLIFFATLVLLRMDQDENALLILKSSSPLGFISVILFVIVIYGFYPFIVLGGIMQ